MTAYSHACCYELPKLEFQRNPLKKKKKEKNICAGKLFSDKSFPLTIQYLDDFKSSAKGLLLANLKIWGLLIALGIPLQSMIMTASILHGA